MTFKKKQTTTTQWSREKMKNHMWRERKIRCEAFPCAKRKYPCLADRQWNNVPFFSVQFHLLWTFMSPHTLCVCVGGPLWLLHNRFLLHSDYQPAFKWITQHRKPLPPLLSLTTNGYILYRSTIYLSIYLCICVCVYVATVWISVYIYWCIYVSINVCVKSM